MASFQATARHYVLTSNVSRSFRRRPEITDQATARRCALTSKVAAVMKMFGLTVERFDCRQASPRGKRAETHSCCLEINDGDIVYITGPSGCGKTVLLKELEQAVPDSERINLNDVELPDEVALVDCIEGNFLTALRLLSIAGLNDVFCVLSSPANLSDGQKYRFRLAMALAAERKFVFADEFCSNLDRITASVISYNIRGFAKRAGVTFILASSQEDMLIDLAPEVLVVKELSGATQVIYKNEGRRRMMDKG